MTHSPADQQYREKQAGALQIGDHVFLPGDGPAEQITHIEIELDDFGVPALILVTTADGGNVRIAIGSSVPVGEAAVPDDVDAVAEEDPAPLEEPDPGDAPDAVTSDGGDSPDEGVPAVVVPPLPALAPTVSRAAGPDPAQLALIPEPTGSPEDVVAAAAEVHPGRNGVAVLSERLVKGINTKSGSCLRDLSDLAHDLFIELRDPDHALAVADILNVLPYDGNRDRWMSVERSLALSSFICRELGQPERADVYDQLLQAPDTVETDPFKARIAAKVRQRALNEPNLYDKEIFRSIDNGNRDAEREWRLLRLETLLFLRSHGGSNTIGVGELDHRIANELEAVRA
ncbi:hypothetical protein KNN17_20460 [Arthrobacter bambusae]|uniref:DUF6707 family protein n=1 Tax=Arthrobacter TaxID=1663 RepID=UPI001F511E52|nr:MULTISPECIES: DUF6707 family protein [Arthrobacter]MCI0143937.1 hypothetical protein [Arthrobacter bambusae]UYY81883.1 hypothetical protein OIT41_02060 [Arthrobacter sp. YA7-1]